MKAFKFTILALLMLATQANAAQMLLGEFGWHVPVEKRPLQGTIRSATMRMSFGASSNKTWPDQLITVTGPMTLGTEDVKILEEMLTGIDGFHWTSPYDFVVITSTTALYWPSSPDIFLPIPATVDGLLRLGGGTTQQGYSGTWYDPRTPENAAHHFIAYDVTKIDAGLDDFGLQFKIYGDMLPDTSKAAIDANNNGEIGLADWVHWKNSDQPGMLYYWRQRYGFNSPGSGTGLSAGGIPEPISGVLIVIGIALITVSTNSGRSLRRRHKKSPV